LKGQFSLLNLFWLYASVGEMDGMRVVVDLGLKEGFMRFFKKWVY
jgi:hypothetical protein